MGRLGDCNGRQSSEFYQVCIAGGGGKCRCPAALWRAQRPRTEPDRLQGAGLRLPLRRQRRQQHPDPLRHHRLRELRQDPRPARDSADRHRRLDSARGNAQLRAQPQPARHRRPSSTTRTPHSSRTSARWSNPPPRPSSRPAPAFPPTSSPIPTSSWSGRTPRRAAPPPPAGPAASPTSSAPPTTPARRSP